MRPFVRHLISAVGLVFLFSSCSPHPLTVQTRYLSHENLASFHINTPDPTLDNPPIGERLLIQWSLDACADDQQPLVLHIHVRFQNHKEQEIQLSIKKKTGYYHYDLLNDDFLATGGILTYLVEIRTNQSVITSWKHPLWTPLITFEKDL